MPNYFKPIKFERQSGEITAESACLMVGNRTIVGMISTAQSPRTFDPDTSEQITMALELAGGTNETVSDYIFVYGVTFDSYSPNSVTEMPCLMIRKRDISAIAIGAYGVFDNKWTEEEIKAAEAQREELQATLKREPSSSSDV